MMNVVVSALAFSLSDVPYVSLGKKGKTSVPIVDSMIRFLKVSRLSFTLTQSY